MQQAVLQSTEKAASYSREGRRWLLMTAGIALAVLAVLAGTSYLRFGSVAAGLSYLAGDRLIVDSRVKKFGEVGPGREQIVRFNLMNWTANPVRILGARTSCTCVVADQLPMTIPAGAKAQLQMRVRSGRKSGAVRETITLYTDLAQKPHLGIELVGRMVE